MSRTNSQQCQSIDTCPHMADAAEKAADHAVKKVFAILGVDVGKPESVELAKLRQEVERLKRKVQELTGERGNDPAVRRSELTNPV